MTNPPAGARKKVVFLTFYSEAWDALAEVHALMARDSRFEVQVVAIDRRLTGETEFTGANKVSAFFDGLGISHLVNADLAGLFGGAGPDYIFVNYPWQRNYAPQYRPDKLAKVARIVYVPYYSLPMTKEPVDGVNPASGFIEHAPHLYSQRMHQLTAIDTRQFGSTKLDALVHEVEKLAERAGSDVAGDRKRLLWAPHHSYSPHWLNFGNFPRVHEDMLQWVAEHSELDVVLRAHPFMFGTLVDRGVMSRAALDNWLERWSALPNASVEVGESAAESFAAADYLLTDGISFLAEWPLAKNLPGLFMENPEHWPFTEIGTLAAAANVVVHGVGELDGLLLGAGAMPDRSAEIAALRAAAMPNAGHTAARIVDAVATDKSELIDPESVLEIPWELQPGREPLD
jgi:hypothetical protein